MRRPRNAPGGVSNPLRDLLAERYRAAELARARQRERAADEELESLIESRVGEQMQQLEARLVEGFREMGQRVVEQSTDDLTSQLEGRIAQLEQISVRQTETIVHLRDSSAVSDKAVTGVVNTIETALGDAVPGFRLDHSQFPKDPRPDRRELAHSQDRSVEDVRAPTAFCPKCTSTNVRRASRDGMWEEFLRLFFIAPFRCRSCRYKFYKI